MRPAILLLGWPRIEGREHLRGVKGPLLMVSNHVADVDPGFILTALPAGLRHRAGHRYRRRGAGSVAHASAGPRLFYTHL